MPQGQSGYEVRGAVVKIKWKVADAPTGKYRAFYDRGWPSAYYTHIDKPAVFLTCDDGYVPAQVRAGKHSPIWIRVLHHNHERANGSWVQFKLKQPAATLEQAKQRAEAFLMGHPDWWPKESK
jgi:hypothetical protein